MPPSLSHPAFSSGSYESGANQAPSVILRLAAALLHSFIGGNTMQDVFILSAVRTAIGKFGGTLAGMSASDLGVAAATAAMQRASVAPEQVEETIFGNARQAG